MPKTISAEENNLRTGAGEIEKIVLQAYLCLPAPARGLETEPKQVFLRQERKLVRTSKHFEHEQVLQELRPLTNQWKSQLASVRWVDACLIETIDFG